MDLQFYKLVAAKNDLLLVNLMDEVSPGDRQLALIARTMCKRRTGIGAQGLVFLLPGQKRSLSLRYFSPDGTESFLIAEPAIYASRYLFDAGIFGKEGLVIEAGNTEHIIKPIDSANFTICLGTPADINGSNLSSAPITTQEPENLVRYADYKGKVPLTMLNLGVNGAVFFRETPLKGLRSYAKKLLGSLDVNDSELWSIIGVHPFKTDEIQVRAWGTQGSSHPVSTAAIGAVASMIQGFSDHSSLVHIRGSQFFVQWNEESAEVSVTGSARYVFTGSYFYDLEGSDA